MEKIILWFLIINFIFVICYGIYRAYIKQEIGVIFFHLFLPGLSLLIYFLPHWIQKFVGIENYDRESLVKRYKIEKSLERPDIKTELDVVPVEDAMAVSKNSEKRSLLLNQLKKDIHSNYKELMAAENDKDSESVHYVAAAKMEVYRIQQKKWVKVFKEYENNPESISHYIKTVNALKDFIDSNLMSIKEKELYQKSYCQLIENQMEKKESFISDEQFEAYLIYLADLKKYEKAEKFWKSNRDKVRSETCYMKIMEMFYEMRSEEKFKNCIKELQADAEIRLSADGLDKLRYWLKEE